MTQFHNNILPSNPPPKTSLTIIQRLTAAYKLWRFVLDNFPKKSRYAIGEKIDTAFLDAIESLFTASFQPRNTKLPYLQKATSKMDLVKFFLCIAWEMKDIDNKKYIALSALLEEVGRMLGSWMRNVQVPQDEKTSATPRA